MPYFLRVAGTQLDNLQGGLTILKSALEGLAISFGELLMSAIKNIVGWVQKFVDWLNSLNEERKKVIVTAALIGGGSMKLFVFHPSKLGILMGLHQYSRHKYLDFLSSYT